MFFYLNNKGWNPKSFVPAICFFQGKGLQRTYWVQGKKDQRNDGGLESSDQAEKKIDSGNQ